MKINFIRNFKKVLTNKKGQSFPMTIAITLIILLFIVVISEYFRLMIIAQGVRDALQDSVISTVTENYADVYHGVREGYSGGYQPSAETFQESLNYGSIYVRLADVLGMDYANGLIKASSTNELQFELYDLQVTIRNAPFASSDDENSRFEADAQIVLDIPVRFGSSLLPNMVVNVKTTAGYTPIF